MVLQIRMKSLDFIVGVILSPGQETSLPCFLLFRKVPLVSPQTCSHKGRRIHRNRDVNLHMLFSPCPRAFRYLKLQNFLPKQPQVGFKGLLRCILQKAYQIDNVLTLVSMSGQSVAIFKGYRQSQNVRVEMSKFTQGIYLEI